MDAPDVIYGIDDQLHIALCDDSEDTNNDGYVDREVYYTFADITTGIADDIITKANSINAYPNPSQNGIFKLDTDELFTVIVTNISGKLVLKTTSNQAINLSNQAKGVYILKGQNNTGLFSVMLVKE
jgi:hypothetical protein